MDHSEVMKCLGGLERGQDDVITMLTAINVKMSDFQTKQVDGRISSAEEKVKSKLLYWVIGIAAGALIVALVNFTFHVKESKYLSTQPAYSEKIK